MEHIQNAATHRDQPGLRPNRACRPCVQIKAKCIPMDGTLAICERCHRLGKSCTTPVPAPRRIRRTPSKITEPQHDASDPTGVLRRYQIAELPTPASSHVSNCALAQDSQRSNKSPEPTLNPLAHLTRASTQRVITPFDVSPEIGHPFVASTHEALFEQYSTHQSRYFPFVPIPPGTSITTMMREKPFLYTCCVMCASHRDPPLQIRIVRDILKYVSEHVLLAGEKSLDLLQGLLLVTSWYHVYNHNNAQLMNLLHLAKALLIDMGLNRAPMFGTFQIKMAIDATRMIHGNDHLAQSHNLEERRACLGLYHVYSRFSTAFRRIDPIVWTEHLEECCIALNEAAKYPSDAYAVALVQIDHLLERYTGPGGFRPGVTMPIPTYVKLFSEDIDRFKQSLPDALRNCPLMLADIETAEVALFEPVIGADSDVPAHRIEAYHACLKKVISYFNTFMSQDIPQVPDQPFLSWVTIAHAKDILARLCFVHLEGWDLDYVRSTPGFLGISDQLIAMLKRIHAYEESEHPTSKSVRFRIFSVRLEMFKQWYESKLQQEQPAQQPRPADAVAEDGQPSDCFEPLPIVNDFSDLLWQDFTIDWSRLDSDFNIT